MTDEKHCRCLVTFPEADGGPVVERHDCPVHAEPAGPLRLLCAGCIQDARNREAAGETALPILPAVTVLNGVAICDVEGRHRIVSPQEFVKAQASGLLVPQPGALPPMNGKFPPQMGR